MKLAVLDLSRHDYQYAWNFFEILLSSNSISGSHLHFRLLERQSCFLPCHSHIPSYIRLPNWLAFRYPQRNRTFWISLNISTIWLLSPPSIKMTVYHWNRTWMTFIVTSCLPPTWKVAKWNWRPRNDPLRWPWISYMPSLSHPSLDRVLQPSILINPLINYTETWLKITRANNQNISLTRYNRRITFYLV